MSGLYDFTINHLNRKLHHTLGSIRAGDQPAVYLFARSKGSNSLNFRNINWREKCGEEIDLTFSQNFAKKREFAADIAFGINRVDYKSKIVHTYYQAPFRTILIDSLLCIGKQLQIIDLVFFFLEEGIFGWRLQGGLENLQPLSLFIQANLSNKA